MAIRRKFLIIFLLCGTTLFAQSGGQPINVPIQNPSFEQAPTIPFKQDPCGPWIYEVPGWTINVLVPGDGAGIFQPAIPNPCGVSPAPDGKTVAYLSGSSISQNLGVAPGNNGVYVYTIYFGDRFYYYSAAWSASVKLGDDVICSASGEARGDFTQVPIVCPVQKNPTPRTLVITITGNGEFQLLLDKVSLTFMPSS